MSDLRFSCAIVGAKYHKQARERLLALQDGATVLLVRERANKHDRNAVAVWSGNMQVGYIPANQAKKVAPVMDARGREHVPARFDKQDGERCYVSVTFVGVGS